MASKLKSSQIIGAVLAFAFLLAPILLSTPEVYAEPTITLKFSKDFGYNSFGNEAQGHWTAHATVSDDTKRVEFYLDDILQLNDTETPFAWSYNTDNYTQGLHTIKAVAFDTNGNEAFAEAQQKFVALPLDFIIGIPIAVVAIMIIAIVILLRRTKKEKEARNNSRT